MPTFTGGVARGNISWQFLTGGGDKASTSFPVNPAATPAQRTALRDAIGNASNAGMIAEVVSAAQRIAETAVETFDEAYAEASTKALFLFEDPATLETVRLSIPAPDAAMFGPDGVTVDPANVRAQAIVTAAIAYSGNPNLAIKRAYRVIESRSLPRPRTVPGFEEPGAGELPGPEPALPPGDV